MFWLIDSCQNSVSADQYRLTLSRAQASTHWVRVFFCRYPLISCYFSIIAGSSSIFSKCIWNKSCSWAALLKRWFRTGLGRENSTGFYIYMQGRQSLLTFLTVTRWSRSTSNFYVLIGQNLTGEFMRKIYAASGNLLTDSWSWQSFVSSCDVLNCLFLLGAQNEIQLLSRLFCNSWLVCLLRFLHRLSKSLEIRFRMASFSKMSLLSCPCLRRKRVEKFQAIREHLMPFRSSISTGKPEQF